MEATLCIFCENHSLPVQDNEETMGKFIRQIVDTSDISGVTSSEVSLCDECYFQVGKAVGWREQVGEVERDVRSLQRIILKMMRQLTSLQGNYLEEMHKLERKIRKYQCQNGKLRKKPGSKNAKMVQLREGVLHVTTELRSFTARHSETSELPTATQRIDPDDIISSREYGQHESLDVGEDPTSCLSIPLTPNREESVVSPAPDLASPSIANDFGVEFLIKTEPCDIVPDEEEAIEMNDEVNPPPPTSDEAAAAGSRQERSYSDRRKVVVPKPCPHCDKKFRSEVTLQNHVRMHEEARPYKCNRCPKAFRHQGSLSHHKKEHAAVKPFQCPHCPQAFSRNDKLTRHLNGKTHAKMSHFSIGM